jgi:hypothetical protein
VVVDKSNATAPLYGCTFLANQGVPVRVGSLGSATGQHGPEFPDLGIYSSLLRLETFDGGGDDFGIQFWRGHVNSCSIPWCCT